MNQNEYESGMPVAICYDLDTSLMRKHGLSDSDRTRIYERVHGALLGLPESSHPQGSLFYATIVCAPDKFAEYIRSILRVALGDGYRFALNVRVFPRQTWSEIELNRA